MKKISFISLICISLNVFGQSNQNEHEKVIPEDTLIKIASQDLQNQVWNFSGIDFQKYQIPTDFDLDNIQNTSEIFSINQSISLGDSIIGMLPGNIITDGVDQYNFSGSYKFLLSSIGTLIFNNDTITGVKKTSYLEIYYLISKEDTIAYYNNTYTSFFNTSGQLLLEVFNKNRELKGNLKWNFVGVSFCKSCINNEVTEIDLTLSPNPSDENTDIAYVLPIASSITISISNQSNNLNSVVYAGNSNEGFNHYILNTSIYSSGSYTITVTTSFGQFSKSIIIL